MSKEEQQKEANEMTLTTTKVMQSVKLVFFDKTGKPHPAASMQLKSKNESGENMRSVSVNGGIQKESQSQTYSKPKDIRLSWHTKK